MRFLLLFAFVMICGSVSCSTPDHEVYTPNGIANEPIKSKTIVLIHGMYMTPKSWDEWKKFFENDGYTVLAPAWSSAHSESAKSLRDKHPNPELAPLTLEEIVASYGKIIDSLPEKPILIGHSMGGLIVQILLNQKRGAAGIAIDSAPAKGVLSLRWSFLRTNWPVLSPFADVNEPISLSQEQFHYAFTNCLPEVESKAAYEEFAVPESRRAGKGALNEIADIDYDKKTLPLLFVAGGEDNIIPASLNYSNFQKYDDSASLTEFKLFKDRCHFTVGQDKWEEVATYVRDWIRQRK